MGLEASLLLLLRFSAKANTSDGEEMEPFTLLCVHCCRGWNKEEGLAGQGAPTAIWGTRPCTLLMDLYYNG